MAVVLLALVESLLLGTQYHTHPQAHKKSHHLSRVAGLKMGWSDPDWGWGYADGAAHNVAMETRSRLVCCHCPVVGACMLPSGPHTDM